MRTNKGLDSASLFYGSVSARYFDCPFSDGMLKRSARIQSRVHEAQAAEIVSRLPPNRISTVMTVYIWAINPTVAINPNQHTMTTAMAHTCYNRVRALRNPIRQTAFTHSTVMGNQDRKATKDEMSHARRVIREAFPELVPVFGAHSDYGGHRAPRDHTIAFRLQDEQGKFRSNVIWFMPDRLGRLTVADVLAMVARANGKLK